MTAAAKPRAPIERTEHPHVVKSVDTLGGEPRVENTRISVRRIFYMVTGGMTIDEISEGYPSLTPAQIHDAVSYAYEHPDEIAYYNHHNKLRTIMKELDSSWSTPFVYPRAKVRLEELPPGAVVYTWETLPKQEDE